MIILHADWALVEKLEHRAQQPGPDQELFSDAAKLIRELKADYADARDDASRLRFPDTSGQ